MDLESTSRSFYRARCETQLVGHPMFEQGLKTVIQLKPIGELARIREEYNE